MLPFLLSNVVDREVPSMLSKVVEREVPSMLSKVVETGVWLESPGVSVLEPLKRKNEIC